MSRAVSSSVQTKFFSGFLLSFDRPFFMLLFLDTFRSLQRLDSNLRSLFEPANSRHKHIWHQSIVRMSKARKYVRIKSRVNGRAKRTNTCPAPCKRNLSVQKLVWLKTCPAPCKRGLSLVICGPQCFTARNTYLLSGPLCNIASDI